MAYETKMAAALSGATVSQLRHWRSARTGPLLAPEIAATPRAVYSFQDVLALRTFVRLREHASLQNIRGAIGSLPDIGEAGHPASYRLVSDKRGNIQLVTEDQAVNLGEKPGQLNWSRSSARSSSLSRRVPVSWCLISCDRAPACPSTRRRRAALRSSPGPGCPTTRSPA
ncbi:MAG TPA: MerR family transcriptional regulator [Streptosporangiaceae bacterium]|nr:MerR family transcriptional regulator [Streptosporangiaceae bacterium]